MLNVPLPRAHSGPPVASSAGRHVPVTGRASSLWLPFHRPAVVGASSQLVGRAVISPPQWGWQKKSCPAARKLRRRVPVAENIATELPDRIPQTPSSELHGEVSRSPLAHRQNCKNGPSVHRRTPTNKLRQPRPPGGRRDATGHFSLRPYPPGDLPPRRLLRYFLQNTPPR